MGKISLSKATELYVSAWNEYSNSYMDLDSVKETILGVKSNKDRETLPMLTERIGRLRRMKEALYDKWIKTTDHTEVSCYKHYKAVQEALKAAEHKLDAVLKITRASSSKGIDEAAEHYAG